MNRFALIAAGVVGAGVHAAIAPEHLARVGAARGELAVRPDNGRAATALGVLLEGIAAAYLVTRVVALRPTLLRR